MHTSPPNPLLSRLLFLLTVVVALALIGTVVLAPLFDRGGSPGSGSDRVLKLFARDATLRRTALASAAGLLVTAGVFFRVPGRNLKSSSSRRPPPPDIAGA